MSDNKFTFGLWTVGNPGRDPFGEPVRKPMSPVQIVHLLAEVGAMGVNFHDNDLVPITATPSEHDQIVRDFKKALADTGLVVPMATTNLFTDPAFKDGAFTSNDAKVRAYALQKTMRSMDLGYDLGARIYVMWGGREGTESDATKNPLEYRCRWPGQEWTDIKLAPGQKKIHALPLTQAGELLRCHQLTSGDTVRSACGGRVHGNFPKQHRCCE